MASTVWYKAYITDDNGVNVFSETCTESAIVGIVRNLERKIQHAKDQPEFYAKHFDASTAKVVAGLDMESCPYDADEELAQLSDEELLAELFAV